MGYPVLLNLRGRRVLVVGGGKVGTRKVINLLDEGAAVTVISPQVDATIDALGERIAWQQVVYAPGMLSEIRPVLVFACTDSVEVNEQVAEEGRELGILVNRTDDGSASDFTNMAKIERGEITIGLATGGAAPALAAHLREKLEADIGEEYTPLAQMMGEVRPLVMATVPADARAGLWQSILDSAALDYLRDGDEVGARAMIDELICNAQSESD